MIFPQLLVNGIINGCAYSLVALGFGMIYSTTRIFHLGHGAVYTFSAYLLYTFCVLLKLSMSLSFFLSLVFAMVLGLAMEKIVYRPLYENGSSPLVQMLSSMGMYIVIVNILAMVYGGSTKILRPNVQQIYAVGSVVVTRIQIITFFLSVFLIICYLIFLRKTAFGRILRGMRDDADLALAVGVNPNKVRGVIFAMGSGFASISSMLVSIDLGVDPHMGMPAVLIGAISVIIGGVGVFEAAAVGALILGILQSLIIWKSSARWQDSIIFAVLILFLVFRPQGILGRKKRVEEDIT